MHPLNADLIARMVIEERLSHAAEQRRLRARDGVRPTLRARVGAGLVHLGTRLQARGHAAPRPVTGC